MSTQSTTVTVTPGVSLPVPEPSAEDSLAAGKALRERVSRQSHGEWKAVRSERDAIAILRSADAARLPELVPIRYGRMLQSPFAFFRGSAAVMAADLADTPSTGIVVQACGDCHLSNFGAFATPERNVVFDINDFDETLPAPWEWDLKRLAASFVLAGRANGFAKGATRDITLACLESYRTGILGYAAMSPLELWYTRFSIEEFIAQMPAAARSKVRKRVEKAMAVPGSSRVFPKLTQVVHGQVRIHDNPPFIFHPESTKLVEFRSIAEDVLKRYRETLSDDKRVLLDHYHYVDAAIKVVGVGSVGTRCWAVLLMAPSNEPLFLQLKQAGPSVLEQYTGKSVYPHSGQRVVMGQRLMQAASDMFLGWVTGPAGPFYVRQLRDAKLSVRIETLDPETLAAYAVACGKNLARAHAKSGNAWMISGYLGKSDAFDRAIADFASAYADQAERDHAALKAAVESREIEAFAAE